MARVRELAYFQGGWHNRNVTADAAAPAASSGSRLAGFPVASGDPRVYYLASAGHMRELAYFQGGWHTRDLTADAGAPAASSGTALAGFPDTVGDTRVYYIASGLVRELAYFQNTWHNSAVVGDAGPPPVAGSPLAAFPLGDPRVYYRASGDGVRELTFVPDTRPGPPSGEWQNRNITGDAGAPPVGANSALTAFPNTVNGDPRVYYVDLANHIQELAYFQDNWHHRDITADAGAPAVADGSALAGFPVGVSGHPRVYYVDPASHVQELAYFQDNWHHRDITADAGAPAAAARSVLAAFRVAGSDPRVYYLGPGGGVRELAHFQNGWHHRNVTADSGAPDPGQLSPGLIGFRVGLSDPRVYYLD
ncbi:MAG: hypothetical protein ACRDZO_15740 [Egibacteraceae bacterium]